jgi:hypothetical protein
MKLTSKIKHREIQLPQKSFDVKVLILVNLFNFFRRVNHPRNIFPTFGRILLKRQKL